MNHSPHTTAENISRLLSYAIHPQDEGCASAIKNILLELEGKVDVKHEIIMKLLHDTKVFISEAENRGEARELYTWLDNNIDAALNLFPGEKEILRIQEYALQQASAQKLYVY